MARLTSLLVVCLVMTACATAARPPVASPGSLPSRAALRAAFEKIGVKLEERSLHGNLLVSTNSHYGDSERSFLGVEIVGDPVNHVIVNLGSFSIDRSGRFSGSALIDVMDSADPGFKRWFMTQESNPRLNGSFQELYLNGLIAQIPATHVPGAVLVIETPQSASSSL